jgi:gamma-glutamyltranspeptidase/glutathione hydrolase
MRIQSPAPTIRAPRASLAWLVTFGALALTDCGGHRPGPQIGSLQGPERLDPRNTYGKIPPEWRYSLATQPTANAEHVMVASDAALATQVGVEVLRSGGNAVDAAVATAFALAVAYPEAGNIGGGGFMVVHTADGKDAALDFREMAPRAATHDMYLDSSGEVTKASVIGHRASGVPGSVAGLWEAHHKFGTKPWKDLIQPAITLAERGFIVDERLATSVQNATDRITKFEGSAALLMPNGKPLQTGTTWRNPDLAVTLRRIADRGPAGFYEGETAGLIVAEMKRGGGIITLEDLKAYQPKWRDPVQLTYRGHKVIAMPPASSGGITLGLALNILEGYDLRKIRWHSAQELHLIAEAERRAFADRNAFLGDPDFARVPRDLLVSKQYAQQQRATIDLLHATPSASIRPGLGKTAVEGMQTTHFDVVDTKGNAVAITTTLNDLYGSAVAVTGAGFFLNDEMDDFSAKPGTPNMFGLVQGEANAIAPGKRMLSAMTPTIVLDTLGRPLIVTGARGGPRIISAVLQILINVLDYEMDIGAAVAAPRIHNQHLPDQTLYERDGFNPAMIDSLTAFGHKMVATGGIATAPSLLRVGKFWTGVADPRTGGSAEGF